MRARLYYTVEVRDKAGRLRRRFTRRAHSFLEQYNELVYIQNASVLTAVKDTGGTERSIDAHADNLNIRGTLGVTLRGIRVGTGNTAVAITDYALETAIAEGTGSGQMEHQAVTFTVPTVAGSDCSYTIKRIIANNSGATITVKEIGLYCRMYYAAAYYACIVRDVLSSTVDVPDGGAITVIYTVKVTV